MSRKMAELETSGNPSLYLCNSFTGRKSKVATLDGQSPTPTPKRFICCATAGFRYWCGGKLGDGNQYSWLLAAATVGIRTFQRRVCSDELIIQITECWAKGVHAIVLVPTSNMVSFGWFSVFVCVIDSEKWTRTEKDVGSKTTVRWQEAFTSGWFLIQRHLTRREIWSPECLHYETIVPICLFYQI